MEAALASVRLEDFATRKPNQLSGGQRQRVALARALVNRPKVLLLDEPLGALDLKLREEMQVELKQIQQQVGITFIFVTHDQGEALSMSDRVAVFNHGKVEQVGPPREVYEQPATEFVAGFVGTANLLPDGDGLVTVRPERIRFGAPTGDETGATGTVDATQLPRRHHPLPRPARGRIRPRGRGGQHHHDGAASPSATPCSWRGVPPIASEWVHPSLRQPQPTDTTTREGTCEGRDSAWPQQPWHSCSSPRHAAMTSGDDEGSTDTTDAPDDPGSRSARVKAPSRCWPGRTTPRTARRTRTTTGSPPSRRTPAATRA